MSNRSSEVGKNRTQNIECSFRYVDRSAVVLEPNVANILIFKFCEQKFVQYGPIMIAIDYSGHSLLISEEKWPNYASGPKSVPNSGLFWVLRLFNVSVQVFCAPNATILLLSSEKMNWLQLLNQLDFIWCHTKIFMQYSP